MSSAPASGEADREDGVGRCHDAPPAGGTADLDRFWQHTVMGMHVVYLGLLGLAIFVIVTSDMPATDRALAVVLLVIMIATYLLVGWRELGVQRPVPAAVHLIVSWLCFYGLALLGTDLFFLLFGLIPHIWAFLPRRRAVVATPLLFAGLLVVVVSSGLADTGGVLSDLTLSMVLSLLIGLFITGAFIQAERRAELIDELERTRADLASTEHARGVLAERQRLAGEIHDTLAQGFTSVLTLVQAAEASLDGDRAAVRRHLDLIEQTARDNLAEARALVGELAPADLQSATLPDAVARVAARFGDQTGIDAAFEVDGEPLALPANTEVVALRVTQEALSNVRRHAGAASVHVTLTYAAGESVAVNVTDDGRGFDPATANGHGITGMRQRVEQVGGDLSITSGSRGSAVVATIPVPDGGHG